MMNYLNEHWGSFWQICPHLNPVFGSIHHRRLFCFPAVISFACRTSVSILMSTAMERQEWKDIAWIASDGWAESLPEDGDISYLDAVDGMCGKIVYIAWH